MSVLQRLIGRFLRYRVRSRARGETLASLAARLEASRDRLMPRIMRARDTAGNREALNHFLGIERWSLSRIHVAQSAEFRLDSYRGYRLPDTATLAELQEGFAAARAESIALARELDGAGIDPDLTIRHNDLGELTVNEWLTYIDDHSSREIIRIRQK